MKTMKLVLCSLGLTLSLALWGQGEPGIKGHHFEDEHHHAKREKKPHLDSTYLKHFKQSEIQDPAVVNRFTRRFINAVGGSATGLIGRVAGATVQGGMVSFRGLNPRYSTVTVNGLATPVTEQNIKAFSLGLLPSDAIQAMEVYKGGYYANYGEWGGGNINIVSTADIAGNYLDVSFGLTFQNNFTFNDFVKPQYWGEDFGNFFGYGKDNIDVTRKIVGVDEFQELDRNGAAEQARMIQNTQGIETVTAGPGFDLSIGFGHIFSDNGRANFLPSTPQPFSRIPSRIAVNRARYNNKTTDENGTVTNSEITSFLTDGIYTETAQLEATSQWFYRINENNDINLALTYSHEGSMISLIRYFVGIRDQKDVFGGSIGLIAKQVFMGRLTGNHGLADNLDLSWSLGVGTFNRDEPVLNRFGAQRPLRDQGTESPYLLIIPESSKADVGGTFNSDLNDNTLGGRIDLGWEAIDNRLTLRAGVLFDRLDRDFAARLLTTAKDDFTAPELTTPRLSALDTIFQTENYGPNGYTMIDGTSEFESYNATNDNFAGYLGADFQLGTDWKFSLGGRLENFNQNLDTGIDTIQVDNQVTEFLPSVNLSYVGHSRLAVKAGYSRSLNHPAFRELSPFTFYDFDYRSDIQGNPELQSGVVDNFDLSLEVLFGRNNEYFAVTPFFKRIQNPIEMKYIIRSESPLFSFENAEQATIGGVEIEFAKFLGSSAGLRNLLLSGNITFTDSRIELPEGTQEVASERPLQGQVPLIINAGLTFISDNQRTTATLAYRYVGRYLFSVGDGVSTFPWYEMPRNYLSASFSQRFGNFKLTLAATNLLNTRFAQFEDADLDGKVTTSGVDNEVQRGLAYQTFHLGVSYSF